MQPDGIIKPFDVTEYICACLRTGLIFLVMYPFVFQCTPEALNHRIVIAITSSAHADLNLIGSQNIADLMTSVLNTSIGVMEQSITWLTLIQGHSQSSLHQHCINLTRHI